MTPLPHKTLYFDIDGTLLLVDQDKVKPLLARGRFERSVRNAGFTRLVCVGNFCSMLAVVKELGVVDFDNLGALAQICGGAFDDGPWFRSVTKLVATPERRAKHIEYSGDWWYVDDLADEYMADAGMDDILAQHRGNRVFIPEPNGDGEDILDWLRNVTS